MFTEEEKVILSTNIDPLIKTKSTEYISKTILLLEKKDKIFLRYEQELEKAFLSYSSLNTYFHLKSRIEEQNISEEDLKVLATKAEEHYTEVVNFDLTNQASIMAIKSISDKCPLCGERLILRNISMPQGKKNIYGWRSSWFCNCGYESFSTVSFIERAAELREKSKSLRIALLKQIRSELAVSRVITNKLVCPECSGVMHLFKITIPQGRGNVFGWKSVKRCSSCLHEEYSLKPTF